MSGNFAFLKSERVYLRPLLPDDCQGFYPQWFNDEEVCAGNSHHVFPYTPDAAEGYVRGLATSSDTIALAIVLVQGHQHIGNISLQGIDWVSRSAELAIVIGEKAAWHKGYAMESCRLLCDHGFKALNLHRISCGTFHDNEAMNRLAIALGMKEEGRRREAAFKNGRYLDVVEYGVLRAEYEDAHEDNRE
jgi:ribosomal-protein-alanine N-acetyltransferase